MVPAAGSSLKQLRLGIIAALIGIFLPCIAAEAHGVSAAYTTITVSANRLAVSCALDLTDARAHFPIDTDQDGRISPDEIQQAAPKIGGYLIDHLKFKADGAALPLAYAGGKLTKTASGQEFLDIALQGHLPHPPARLEVAVSGQIFETLGPGHTNLIKLVYNASIQQSVLSINHPTASFSLTRPVSLLSQSLQFLVEGIKHIFLGYDHLMFLVALIVIGGRLLSLVKIVSAFTLAHSITLILAALQIVSLPSRWVESAVALSIAYVALENFLVKTFSGRWRITFFFGLVHGFGFANALRNLGLPSRGLVTSLLCFNVGVEIGQVVIVLLCLPLIQWLSKKPVHPTIVRIVSAVVLTFGTGWFIERAFGLSFMPF